MNWLQFILICFTIFATGGMVSAAIQEGLQEIDRTLVELAVIIENSYTIEDEICVE